jgi:hypothetical protein
MLIFQSSRNSDIIEKKIEQIWTGQQQNEKIDCGMQQLQSDLHCIKPQEWTNHGGARRIIDQSRRTKEKEVSMEGPGAS